MREKTNLYRLLMGNPEVKRSLGRPGHRRVDNIKLDLVEIDEVVWIGWV
jgi:hypothetical protein